MELNQGWSSEAGTCLWLDPPEIMLRDTKATNLRRPEIFDLYTGLLYLASNLSRK